MTKQKKLSEVEVLEAKIVALNTANAELQKENKKIADSADKRYRFSTCNNANASHFELKLFVNMLAKHKFTDKYVLSDNLSENSKFIDVVLDNSTLKIRTDIISLINLSLDEHFKNLHK